MSTAVPIDELLTAHFARCCGKDMTPGKAFVAGATAAAAGYVAFNFLRDGDVVSRAKGAVFAAVRAVAGRLIQKELEKEAGKLTFKTLAEHHVNNALPAEGVKPEQVLAMARGLREKLDQDWASGYLSGTVYHGGKDLTQLINEVLVLFQWTNPLHMDTFGSLRQMESEIVQMTVDIFNGSGTDACGAVTSGGTDSICMAIKTYREHGRENRSITRPNMVVPITAHPAFDKACHYYGIEKITVPVDASTGMVDPDELEKYVTENTVVIIGSAVNYPYGTADDIRRLGEIALRHGCGLHVDCCLGGFVLQFLEAAGVARTPVVDFRVPGVTSISVDTHKFGFAPKGSSVVMFSNKALRRHMYFAIASWPGGLYASPGFNGSRPGNIIAGTWAAMMAMGKDGYVRSASAIYATMRKMVHGINANPHLYVLAEPLTSVVAFTSNVVDVYELKERITKRFGWQLHTLQFPAAIQFSLTFVHTGAGIMEKMLADINTVTQELYEENRATIATGGKPLLAGAGATMYGTQQRVLDRSLVDTMTKMYLDKYYQTEFAAAVTK